MKRPLAYITAAWCGDPDTDMELAARYCRMAYEAGFSPICPILYLPLFINDAIPEEHKNGIDMRRDMLRRSHVLVVCGDEVDEDVKNDIAVAKRLNITATTLDGTRYFEERGIKVYGKSLTRSYLSQLLRNPVYAQADLEMYEFFKSQGTVVVNDAADFAGTNGCYLYQGRDVKEDKDKSLKDQILVIAPHEGFVSADVWLRCRKKLMTNTTFQNGRKARNTWLAGKIKCGKCGYALKTTHNPSGYEYLRCSKRADHKGCPGCGTLRKTEFEQFIFTAMGEKFREFKLLRGGEEKANPKITAYQVELAQVEAEIEKLLDTLTGANATLLAYANKKIEDLDNRRKTLSKAIADLSVETLSSQQVELLSGYLDDWENISFEDKRKAADGLISSISATSDYVKIEWKI